jgi:hypothetical protein
MSERCRMLRLGASQGDDGGDVEIFDGEGGGVAGAGHCPRRLKFGFT